MKILMISCHDVWGGLDTFSPMLKILTKMDKEDIKVDFVGIERTSDFDESSKIYGEPVKFIGENINIERIRIFSPKLLGFLYKFGIVKRIISKIRTEKLFPKRVYKRYKDKKGYDIVYGYEIFAVAAARRLADRYGVPLVTRFQGTFLPSWEEKYGKSYCLKKYKLHYDALSEKADLIIMTNDGTEGDKALKALNNAENMRFWRNGFDFAPLSETKEALREKHHIQNDAFYTISVCRLSAWKRCERIVEAYRYIAKEDDEIKHIFVGDGDERPKLESLIEKYGLRDKFIFAGSKPHEEVKEFLQLSDVFLSFFDSTNAGNPLIEAVKINLPIVTYDVGDTNQIIKDGENGILLDTPEPQKICDSVINIKTDAALRQKLIDGTKKSSNDFISWDKRTENELEELKKLIGR